jgi:hypothetical protein
LCRVGFAIETTLNLFSPALKVDHFIELLLRVGVDQQDARSTPSQSVGKVN